MGKTRIIPFLFDVLATPHLTLRLFEILIHIGLPTFILVSLLDHSTSLLIRGGGLVVIVYLVYLKYRARQWEGAYKTFVSVLPYVVAVAYIDVIWHLYNVGRLQVYTDAYYGYIPQSDESIFDPDFWFFGVKPFLTPLIFKMFGRNMAAVNNFIVTSYLLVTLFVSAAVASLFRGFTEKALVFYLLVLFSLNQSLVGAWLTIAQSEAPTIIVTLLMIGVYAFLYRKRDSLNRSSARTGASICLIFVTTFVFSFSRDTNMYFLPVLVVFYYLVFLTFKSRVIVTAAILSIFAIHNITMERSGRWKFSLANVLMQRIIPDDELRRLFQEGYHLPGDEVVKPAEKKWASEEFENKEQIISQNGRNEDWVSKYGLRAYKHFLITHPGYVISEWVGHWDGYNAGFWRWTLRSGRRFRLNPILFSFPGRLSFYIAVLVLAGGLLLFKVNPVIALTISHSLLIGLIAYHGDAMEVERHLQQAAMTLRISFLILIAVVYDIIGNYLETQRETPE